MRILVVDDHDESRDITVAVLISAGFSDVTAAASAWDALSILEIRPLTSGAPTVDLILLDIVMPNIDGIELLARIRKDGRYANLPIIMLTSLDDMESLEGALIAGASDYLTKPFTRMELVTRMHTAAKLPTIHKRGAESSTH